MQDMMTRSVNNGNVSRRRVVYVSEWESYELEYF